MFVHSLWSQTAAPLHELAEQASRLLGVSYTMSERSAELRVVSHADQITGPDARWRSLVRAAEPGGELQPLRLFSVASAIGIASVNPSLNFRLRDRLAESTPVRPLRLRLSLDPPFIVRLDPSPLLRLGPPGWQLSAMHLQHPSVGTEVIIQGQQENPRALLREAARLYQYTLAGVSLADPDGRMVTVYDEGQLWLQQVAPEEVPGLMEETVLPLLSLE